MDPILDEDAVLTADLDHDGPDDRADFLEACRRAADLTSDEEAERVEGVLDFISPEGVIRAALSILLPELQGLGDLEVGQAVGPAYSRLIPKVNLQGKRYEVGLALKRKK